MEERYRVYYFKGIEYVILIYATYEVLYFILIYMGYEVLWLGHFRRPDQGFGAMF